MRKSAGGEELGERGMEVLRSIVRQHIRSGEPIGSLAVSRTMRPALSPASIRNIMAELEERGLLVRRHTSAGRVPTDKAFRYYVDRLHGPPRMPAGEARAIELALGQAGGELDLLLGEASRQLSQLSNQVGLVLAPDLTRLVVEHLEFVRLDARRVVAILVARSGVVHSRILEVDEPLEGDELERVSRYLSGEIGGRTLPEMRDLLERRLCEDRAAYDRFVSLGLQLGRQALGVREHDAGLFIEGASNLLDLPEFADLDLLRAMFRTLEEKRTLIDLLGRVIEGEGVRVVIGEEHPLSDLARCSLVASTYSSGERSVGTVGIVGPTRMPYARAMALVDHLARVLSRLLATPELTRPGERTTF